LKNRLIGLLVLGIVYIIIGVLFLVILPLFSILYFVAGIGILMLKPFGRYCGLAASILGIIINSLTLAQSLKQGIPLNILIAVVLTYLVHAGIIYYLTRPKVIEQFK